MFRLCDLNLTHKTLKFLHLLQSSSNWLLHFLCCLVSRSQPNGAHGTPVRVQEISSWRSTGDHADVYWFNISQFLQESDGLACSQIDPEHLFAVLCNVQCTAIESFDVNKLKSAPFVDQTSHFRGWYFVNERKYMYVMYPVKGSQWLLWPTELMPAVYIVAIRSHNISTNQTSLDLFHAAFVPVYTSGHVKGSKGTSAE